MKTPPENSSIVNVCIIPDYRTSDRLVQMSQQLGTDSTMFLLDGKEKFAYMTLYMARFDNGEISHVINATSKLLQTTGAFLCRHTGYFLTEGDCLEVSYRKSQELKGLHMGLIKKLYAMRLNPGREPYEESYFAPYTTAQRKNVKLTGYDLAYDLFRPHVTLTRYKKGQMPSIFPAFAPALLSFTASTICVYQADDNGAVQKELASFSIRS